LFAPLFDADTRRQLALNNQLKNVSVERVLLADSVPQHVLRHYLRLVAQIIETDLRNRLETARAGSVCTDMRLPIELDAEIMRRVDQQIAMQHANTDREKRDLPPATQREIDIAAENYRALRVFQRLADLLADRGNELEPFDDPDAAVALFFNTLHISRTLQATLASRRARTRMPDHAPMEREAMRHFRPFLGALSERYARRELFIDEYLECLRRFVFCGVHAPLPPQLEQHLPHTDTANE
jgi:hypothetical protein